MKSVFPQKATLPNDILLLSIERKEAIRKRLDEFRSVPPSDYFYELAYCLLTPQSSARHAAAAVQQLTANDFQHRAFNPESILRNKEHYIRFHHTKSHYLQLLKKQFSEIQSILFQQLPASEIREWLVKNVNGLGYKEATHFLRNIGRNDELAILDRHILRNLKRYGIIRVIPETLSRKTYFRIEKQFQQFAEQAKIPIDELDLLFWSLETGEMLK
ncbi:MAG TPA: N-glycosylase/DNA lyase [Bacteroidota bacterium]|nr:N-glycosylase/DNA lyase [Bacteroidota bacterium]